MPEKPIRASDYPSEQVELVRSTCLYVATKLGDLMDEVVVAISMTWPTSRSSTTCNPKPTRTGRLAGTGCMLNRLAANSRERSTSRSHPCRWNTPRTACRRAHDRYRVERKPIRGTWGARTRHANELLRSGSPEAAQAPRPAGSAASIGYPRRSAEPGFPR